MTEESVVSDKKRMESEADKKPAFLVDTSDASMFEDFPSNPLGLYVTMFVHVYPQSETELHPLLRSTR